MPRPCWQSCPGAVIEAMTISISLRAGRTRRMSYDCYPHALVAAGQIDAVTDVGLEPYDFLPLVPLVEAAGGIITDWQGRALTLGSDGRVVTAATRQLHARMLDLLNG